MNASLRAVAVVTLISSTAAFADVPGHRHAEVERLLSVHTRERNAGNAVMTTGAASALIAMVCSVIYFGIEGRNAARGAAYLYAAPFGAIAGVPVQPPRQEDSAPAGVAALVTGGLGLALMATGLLVRESLAPLDERRTLLLERDALELEERRARALRLRETKEALGEGPVVGRPAGQVDASPPRRPLVGRQ